MRQKLSDSRRVHPAQSNPIQSKPIQLRPGTPILTRHRPQKSPPPPPHRALQLEKSTELCYPILLKEQAVNLPPSAVCSISFLPHEKKESKKNKKSNLVHCTVLLYCTVRLDAVFGEKERHKYCFYKRNYSRYGAPLMENDGSSILVSIHNVHPSVSSRYTVNKQTKSENLPLRAGGLH